MKNDFPLFKNMKLYGFTELSEEELTYVLSGIFGEPVRIRGIRIYNQNGKHIYREYSDGFWSKYEYNDNGNMLYSENSYGEIYDNR